MRTVGVLMVPEPGLHDITLKINGWIDKLYADMDGMLVQKDQPLFELYSPELVVAQGELITAARSLKTLNGQTADSIRAQDSQLSMSQRPTCEGIS